QGDFLIAAPALAKDVGDGRLLYRLKGARTFSLAVLLDYNSLTAVVDGIITTVYYQQADEPSAQAALDTIGKALQFYGQLYGDYPFESLTLAEIDMFDGMEFDGMFFLGRHVFETYKGTPQNNLVLLSAHETAHNWWYSQVGNDQALEPWLDEALCVYSELLFLEEYYPHLTGWWWQFRVNAFEPAGPVKSTIYDYAQYELYRQAVYLRGALFVDSVRDFTGEDDFIDFLHRFLEEGRYQVITAEDFFHILAQVAPEPIGDLKAQYFQE
ncbi:MAG: M1 family aminopeptidase, partial [Anaerolineales bacterium]